MFEALVRRVAPAAVRVVRAAPATPPRAARARQDPGCPDDSGVVCVPGMVVFAIASAITAVAVESALVESRPSQWPAGVRAPSSAARAVSRQSTDVEPGGRRRSEMATTLVMSCVSASEAQVTEREQAIVRVLAVEDVVLPVAVEAAAVGPERVDEIEARLLDRRRCRRGARRARGSPSPSTADRESASRAARGSRPAGAPATAATARTSPGTGPSNWRSAAAAAAVAGRQADRRVGEVVEAAVRRRPASGAARISASLSGTGSRRSW